MLKHSIYQTGTINSLLEAVYDGDTTMAQLATKGDFGLGALDAIDGELVIYDGKFFRANANCHLNRLDNLTKTPFAVISNFQPSLSFTLNASSFADLETQLLAHLPSTNLIYTFRIEGFFAQIDLRSEECTCRPYRRLIEILPALQRTHSFEHLSGTLIGVYFPTYLSQLNVPGFHFHFIDVAEEIGGHVYGLNLTDGQVKVQVIHGLDLSMIATDEFYQANLASNIANEVTQVEKLRS